MVSRLSRIGEGRERGTSSNSYGCWSLVLESSLSAACSSKLQEGEEATRGRDEGRSSVQDSRPCTFVPEKEPLKVCFAPDPQLPLSESTEEGCQ